MTLLPLITRLIPKFDILTRFFISCLWQYFSLNSLHTPFWFHFPETPKCSRFLWIAHAFVPVAGIPTKSNSINSFSFLSTSLFCQENLMRFSDSLKKTLSLLTAITVIAHLSIIDFGYLSLPSSQTTYSEEQGTLYCLPWHAQGTKCTRSNTSKMSIK